MIEKNDVPVGRFAPSPSGRMHLGNIFTAVLSWLSVKSRGGRWILRIEDLDPQRSRSEFASQIEDDLLWLGLEWDEGGVDGVGPNGPYCQSGRHTFYNNFLDYLRDGGLIYPCACRRADLHATQAPHATDGRIVYSGKCRPASTPPFTWPEGMSGCSVRLFVPDEEIYFTDGVYGQQCVNLASHCGDFVLRRADGAWAYQLAVVADDAAMGVTEVVRGNDLLLSTAQQIYLYRLLGVDAPAYCHVPLVCNAEGRRLSKRDQALSMETLRKVCTPEELIGRVAAMAGLIDHVHPCSLDELLDRFSWSAVTKTETVPALY